MKVSHAVPNSIGVASIKFARSRTSYNWEGTNHGIIFHGTNPEIISQVSVIFAVYELATEAGSPVLIDRGRVASIDRPRQGRQC